jgi:hypothetical protein
LDQQFLPTASGPEGPIVFLAFGNDPRWRIGLRITWHDG